MHFKKNTLACIAFLPALVIQFLGAYAYLILWTQSQLVQILYAFTKINLLIWPLVWRKTFKLQWTLNWNKKTAYWGFISGISMSSLFLLTSWIYPDSETLSAALKIKVDGLLNTNEWVYISFSVFLSFAHSLLEEYYWRGFVYKGLSQHFNLKIAAIISSIGFMSHHTLIVLQVLPISWSILASIGVFGAGLIWCALLEKTQSLTSSWLSHILVDLSIMTAGFFYIFQ